MTQRIVNLAAVLIVLFVAVGISAAFIYGKFNPPRPDPGPRISEFKVASRPPPPANETTVAQPATAAPVPKAARQAEEPPEASRQDEEPPKTYTWAEVEELLAAVREERKASSSAWIELENWYARLSSPEFTQSSGHSEHIKKLQAWQAEFPESPNPRVVLGRAYIGYAWDARGSGFALSVSDAGWELFHQRIDESYRLLNESLALGVKDGEVYARLIDVAKAQSASPDEAQEWVEAGIKADPGYFPLYQSMA